ncbi:MAG: tyrosine-type recombinase/integrase [Candidatus Micrarchaeota archaeon]
MDNMVERTEILSPKQVRRLVSHAEKNSKRDALILSFMWKCGLKTNEVAGMQCGHVNQNNRTVIVGASNRVVPVEKGLMGSLSAFLSDVHCNSSDDTYVFRAQGTKNKLTHRRIQNLVKDYAKAVNLGELTPNHIRKSFATYFLKKTNDINALREILGQKDLYTTQRYLGALKSSDLDKLYHKVWK